MSVADSPPDSEIWSADLLGRQADAIFLVDFLNRKVAERGKLGATRSFALNIDATWGDGKSFFLANLRRSLESRGHVVALVNAWADDHADDPLLGACPSNLIFLDEAQAS